MRADPKVRRDGRCSQCKGKRPKLAERDRDPFCRADCCRAFHGVVYQSDEVDLKRVKNPSPRLQKQRERNAKPEYREKARARSRARRAATA